MEFIPRLASVLFLTISLAGTGAIGKDAGTIGRAVLAREVPEGFEPVTGFTPSDVLSFLVFPQGATPGTTVKTNWIIVDAGGMKNKTFFEKEVILTAEVLKNLNESKGVHFSVSNDQPFPAGAYKADIFLDGVLAKTLEFKVEALTYTLDFCGTKKTPKPTEAAIKKAVAALEVGKNDAFLVLSSSDLTYLQTSGDAKTGFTLEYQEGDVKHHYKAKRSVTADEVVKALVSYATGTADWKSTAEWELEEL